MTGKRITGVGFSTMEGSPDMAAMPAILDKAESLGVDVVELSLANEDIVSGCQIIPDRLARLKEIIANRDLRYTVHGPVYANFLSNQDMDRQEKLCAAFLDICGEIGAETMVIHTGYTTQTDPAVLEERYAQQRDVFHRLGDCAKRNGLMLCVENVFAYEHDHHTASPSELANEIQAIGHPNVAATLDFGHANIHCTIEQLDYVAECRAMAPQVRHLHVHDNWGLPNFSPYIGDAEAAALGYGDLHMPVGWGDMQWDTLLPDFPMMEGSVLMLEVLSKYAYALEDSIAKARAFADMINGVDQG